MNPRRMITALLFALCCSGLFTWQISKHLRAPAQAARLVPVRDVIVATRNLPAGDTLDPLSLAVVKWPVSQQYAGMFTRLEDVRGRVSQVAISAGEPIVSNALVSNDPYGNAGASIPPGMRAVSIHATDASVTTAGLLTSGSNVDVIVSYRSDADASFVSSTVLQDVRVLAIESLGASVSGNKPQSDNSLTLLLTPKQVAEFTAASGLGKITFALRNRVDHGLQTDLLQVAYTGSKEHSQVGTARTPVTRAPVSPAAKTGFTVEMLSGGKATVQTFAGDQ